MSKKIEVTSSNNNRALIDESQLERYLEMEYIEGWPKDEDAKEVKKIIEQLDAEEINDNKEILDPTTEDKKKIDAFIAETEAKVEVPVEDLPQEIQTDLDVPVEEK